MVYAIQGNILAGACVVPAIEQAVKLDPDTREYADLLRRAKRLARTEASVPLPVVRAEEVEERIRSHKAKLLGAPQRRLPAPASPAGQVAGVTANA